MSHPIMNSHNVSIGKENSHQYDESHDTRAWESGWEKGIVRR